MGDWLEEHIFAEQRLPLFLCFLAFIVTFLVTRVITRSIRAGKGPFKNNVSESGVHIHHAVPGIILLVLGAFISVAVLSERPWNEIAALLIGIGTALVLDEFALIVHMSDVYWSEQGRISVEMVSLATAGMGLFLLGFSPSDSIADEAEGGTVAGAMVAGLFHLSMVVICVLKGKYGMALLGAFLPGGVVLWAVRLGRPESVWARRRYVGKRAAKLDKAKARTARFDRHFGSLGRTVSFFFAGKPTDVLEEEHELPPASQSAAGTQR